MKKGLIDWDEVEVVNTMEERIPTEDKITEDKIISSKIKKEKADNK